MRILILSRGRSVHATNRLVEETEAAGHEVRVVDPAACCAVCGPRPEVFAPGGRPLAPDIDVVVPRIGSAAADEGVALVAILEAAGVPAVNGARALRAARDKFRCLDTLAAAGVRVPPTALVRNAAQLPTALRAVGGPPVVIKLRYGTQGVGVVLCESHDAVDSVAQTVLALGEPVLLQQLVGSPRGGHDVRALVVRGKVVAAMERRAADGAFRANVHRGGRARRLALDPETERTAVAAADEIGLDVAGVDLIPDRDGAMVLEVNASPGLEAIEKATQVNVAREIVTAAARRGEGSPRG